MDNENKQTEPYFKIPDWQSHWTWRRTIMACLVFMMGCFSFKLYGTILILFVITTKLISMYNKKE